ncbi:hypothetical protein FQZ97_797320 [compost metagenome]
MPLQQGRRRQVRPADQPAVVHVVRQPAQLHVHAQVFEHRARLQDRALAHVALGKAAADHDALHLAPRGLAHEALDHEGQLFRELLDGAMHHVAGGRGGLSLQRAVELLLAQVARMGRAQRVAAGLAAPLAPALEQFAKRRLAGLVADEAVLVAQLQAVAVHAQAGQLTQAVDVGTGGRVPGFFHDGHYGPPHARGASASRTTACRRRTGTAGAAMPIH